MWNYYNLIISYNPLLHDASHNQTKAGHTPYFVIKLSMVRVRRKRVCIFGFKTFCCMTKRDICQPSVRIIITSLFIH